MLMNSIFSVFLISIFLLNISSSPLRHYPLVSLKLENYLKLEINESLYSHVAPATRILLSSPSPKSESPNPSQRTWGDNKIPWATTHPTTNNF